MKINRRHLRFHDAWGRRRRIDTGSVIGNQWFVGLEQDKVCSCMGRVDAVKILESDDDRYVMSPQSVEKLRK